MARKVAKDKQTAERDDKGKIKKGSGSALARRRKPEAPLSFNEFQRRILYNEKDFEAIWKRVVANAKVCDEPDWAKLYLAKVLPDAKDRDEIKITIKPIIMQMPDGFTDDDIYAEMPRKHVANEADKGGQVQALPP